MKIPYKVKDTDANTEYREIANIDKKFLMDKLRELKELADGCKKDPSLKSIADKLNTPNKNIPRMSKAYGGGMNSINSASSGIIDNIESGTQRDFSSKTCEVVTKTFSEVRKVFTDWPEVTFEKVASFDPVTYKKPEADTSGSTFEDLFEITITVRRK